MFRTVFFSVSLPTVRPQFHQDEEEEEVEEYVPPKTKRKQAKKSFGGHAIKKTVKKKKITIKKQNITQTITVPPQKKKRKLIDAEVENNDANGTEGGKKNKKTLRPWKKEDIKNIQHPDYQHVDQVEVKSPWEYFTQFFTMDLIESIVFQSNLYLRQKDVETKVIITKDEMVNFIGVIIFMGVVQCPAIADYWANLTRVSQVADIMPIKTFKTIKSSIHFNNNDDAKDSSDRFFKIRPLINYISNKFQNIPCTPKQCVDEVMIAYKGTMAGNLRQYIQSKPDRFGYKFFCRASDDGFIHDILMYQGATTFPNHSTKLSEDESNMLQSSKVVIALLKTVQDPKITTVYADNFFSSITLVEYLSSRYSCRYVGTARTTRVGDPPLQPAPEMKKKAVPRGTLEYASTNGVLAVRWKDNKVVTMISTADGIEPITTVKRYDKDAKAKIDVSCPNVIKKYNQNMGGVDKSDMLTHLYKSPMRAKRWYLPIFGYVIDICICNAWLLYKRDCNKLELKKIKPLKTFRLEISEVARGFKGQVKKTTRLSSEYSLIITPLKIGQKAKIPTLENRIGPGHFPITMTKRETCKNCSKKGEIHRSRSMCMICRVALCNSTERNCFPSFHNVSK